MCPCPHLVCFAFTDNYPTFKSREMSPWVLENEDLAPCIITHLHISKHAIKEEQAFNPNAAHDPIRVALVRAPTVSHKGDGCESQPQ